MATDSVQRIKEKLSIIDVISPYVELHKAGKNFKGKSPFTSEKTPSFYVSPDRGMYYCFSSAQGGDMFTFIEKMEGVDFKGALKILADKAGIELVPEDPKKRDLRDSLYQILEDATKFFELNLNKSDESLSYLKKRHVSTDTIDKWRIGYAPNDWRQLREFLSAKGYQDSLMLQAGLVKQADQGKQPYDVFRDRIMFPISDPSGRVIGFSGRILSKESEAPKYVNSPETMLFNKSEVLYGYDKAKHNIHKLDFTLIVEGQFDVVLSHQAGYKNAVAVSGTALTPDHVSLLQRLSNRVVLALDSDKAGVAAVKRAAELMLARGIDLKVARLHGGKDPADLVAEDTNLLKRDIKEATHVIEFLLKLIKEETTDERKYKMRVSGEVLPYLLLIESHIDRDHFANIIANGIGVNIESVRLDISRLEANKALNQSKEKAREVTTLVERAMPNTSRKESLLAFLSVLEDLLEVSEAQMLSAKLIEIVGQTPAEIRTSLSESIKSELYFTLENYISETRSRVVREDWEHKLQQLNEIFTKEKIITLKEALLSAEKEGHESIVRETIKEIDILKKRLPI